MMFKWVFFVCVITVINADYAHVYNEKCKVWTLQNGKVRLLAQGRVIQCKCDPGYTLHGKMYSKCLNGVWDTTKPVCINPAASTEIPEYEITNETEPTTKESVPSTTTTAARIETSTKAVNLNTPTTAMPEEELKTMPADFYTAASARQEDKFTTIPAEFNTNSPAEFNTISPEQFNTTATARPEDEITTRAEDLSTTRTTDLSTTRATDLSTTRATELSTTRATDLGMTRAADLSTTTAEAEVRTTYRPVVSTTTAKPITVPTMSAAEQTVAPCDKGQVLPFKLFVAANLNTSPSVAAKPQDIAVYVLFGSRGKSSQMVVDDPFNSFNELSNQNDW